MTLPRCALSLATVLAVVSPISARSALAEEWTFENDDIEERSGSVVRFSGRFDVWISTFDRPPRACESIVSPNFQAGTGVRAPPGEDFYCPSSRSDEYGVGTGVEVAFRVIRPLYVTAGIDFIYTTPDFERLKNQVIIPVPFGLMLTAYEWSFRPIVRAVVMPILYVTDDARDYTLGGDIGFAWRMVDFGDLSFMVGYKTSDTMDGFQLELALHPVF